MGKKMLYATAALLSAGPAALAAAAPGTNQSMNTLGDMIAAGGWTMYVIVGMSVVALFLIVFFLFTLREEVLYPKEFLKELHEAASKGDRDAIRIFCLGRECAAAKIILAALEQVSLQDTVDFQSLSAALEDEGSRQASILWQRIQYLLDIAVVAPMVGLLGTVLGMLQAFAGLQVELGAVMPTQLSQGLAKAMITTAGGLIVGIPAMLIFALFRGRVLRLVAGLELACGHILRQFCISRKKGKG